VKFLFLGHSININYDITIDINIDINAGYLSIHPQHTHEPQTARALSANYKPVIAAAELVSIASTNQSADVHGRHLLQKINNHSYAIHSQK
jgi:hypothetical protein